MGSIGIACLGLVGVVVALALPAWLLSRWFADRGVRPFREAAKHLPRSVVECLLLLCVTFGFIRYGGSKEGGDAGGGQSAPMMALPGVPTVLPVAVDSLGMNIPTNFPPVTNLCFWGVERGSNAVSLGIGHACGWADIYASRNNCTPSILYESPQVSWMPHDWNNGTGCRFYSQLKSQSDIILRLLMHGMNAGGQSDIPSGGVFGLGNDGGTGLMNIGRYGMTTVSPHSN